MPPAWMKATLLLILSVGVATGCRDTPQLRARLDGLDTAANECLLDVRDRGQSWEASRNCASLSPLADAYIEAGGFSPDLPTGIQLREVTVQKTAWMARACSLPGGRGATIW